MDVRAGDEKTHFGYRVFVTPQRHPSQGQCSQRLDTQPKQHSSTCLIFLLIRRTSVDCFNCNEEVLNYVNNDEKTFGKNSKVYKLKVMNCVLFILTGWQRPWPNYFYLNGFIYSVLCMAIKQNLNYYEMKRSFL